MDRERLGKVGAGVIGALVVVVALLWLSGVVGVPDAGLEHNSWGEVDDERIEILTTVWIDNPNPLGSESDVEYEVELAGVQIAAGSETGVDVPPGRTTRTFSTDVDSQQIQPWWSRHLSNGEVSTLVVDTTVHTSVGPFPVSRSDTYEEEIDTDIEGALDRGFSQFEGSYTADTDAPDWTGIDPTVEVENVTARWGEVTNETSEMAVTVRIRNPNRYPIPVPGFTGSVAFNDVPLADWTADEVELRNVSEDALIDSGEAEQRTFLIEMDNGNLPEWFGTHVDNGEYTRVVVSGSFALTVDGYEVTLPPGGPGITCEFDLTTSIFVDQEGGMSFDRCQ
jgi:LEA14-like dessication related protein